MAPTVSCLLSACQQPWTHLRHVQLAVMDGELNTRVVRPRRSSVTGARGLWESPDGGSVADLPPFPLPSSNGSASFDASFDAFALSMRTRGCGTGISASRRSYHASSIRLGDGRCVRAMNMCSCRNDTNDLDEMTLR